MRYYVGVVVTVAVLDFINLCPVCESFLTSRATTLQLVNSRLYKFALHTPLQLPETNGKALQAGPFQYSLQSGRNATSVFDRPGSGALSSKVTPPTATCANSLTQFGATRVEEAPSTHSPLHDPLLGGAIKGPNKDVEATSNAGDLNHNLESLRRELESKNQRFRQTVHNLQAESDRTLASVQQWDQYYRTKMHEISHRAAETEETLQSREHQHQTQLLHLQQESTRKDITAADKVYWLAQQLQKFKFQAHQQELEEELAACNKHLKDKLERLQVQLDQQVKMTESERAKHGSLWKQRIALETEVAVIQKELQASIQSLKDRLEEEKEKRHRDKQLHEVQLAQHEAQLEERLLELKNESMGLHKSLESQVTENEELRRKVLQAGNDAVQVQDRELLLSEQSRLRDLLQQKEKELEAKIVALDAANDKAYIQWTKRIELEKELSSVKHEFDSSVKAWECRFEALEATRLTEVGALRRLLAQREAETAEIIRATAEEAEQQEVAFARNLTAKEEEYKNLLTELELSAAKEKKDLNQTLILIRRELETYKSDSEEMLANEMVAFRTRQAELTALLSSKEDELIRQAQVTNSMDETSKSHLKKIEELGNELSALKVEHESALSEASRRIETLEHEHVAERRKMEELLSSAEAQARAKIEATRDEANSRQAVLQRSHEEAQALLKLEIRELIASFRKKEEQMNATIHKLSEEYLEVKAESQRQLSLVKGESESHLQNLTHTLGSVERQLGEQVRLTEAAEARFNAEWKQKAKLEEEVASLSARLLEAKREEERLQARVESMAGEFKKNKEEVESRLVREREDLKRRHDELISALSAKEEELLKLSDLVRSTEETAKVHWQRRTDLEKELSSLKYKYDSSIAEWEDRFNALQRKRNAEQQRMEAVLAQTKEQARVKIEASRQEVEEQRQAIEANLESNTAQLRQEIQLLLTSSQKKEVEMNTTIQSLISDLHEYKAESQRRLAAAQNAMETKQKELISLLAAKDLELQNQLKLSAAAENRTRAEIAQRTQLEAELTTMKYNFENHVAQWEARYNGLFESRDQALQKAEALIARKEADSRVIIDSLYSEAEAAKAAYEDSLRHKDRQLELKLREVQEKSDKKLLELHKELQEVAGSYQQFKSETRELIDQLNSEIEAAKRDHAETLQAKEAETERKVHEVLTLSEKKLREVNEELLAAREQHQRFKIRADRALATTKEEWEKKVQELRSQIQKKEEEMAASTVVRRSTADEVLLARSKKRKGFQRQGTLQPSHGDIESELKSLRTKYEAERAEWETRYKALQNEAQAKESSNDSALVARLKAEADRRVRAISEELNVRQRELKSEIQSQSMRHNQAMQQLSQDSQAKEAELRRQLRLLESELQSFESKAQQDLEAERAASLAKQVELVTQIEQSQRQMEKVLELLAKERDKKP